jgi:hypothetical protein
MGLDNYFKRTVPSPDTITFPEGLRLCGGMFSGHGSDGSFRGKVYVQFFEQNLGVSLYSELNRDEVAEIAEKLSVLVKTHPDQAWNGNLECWQEDAPSQDLGYYGVTAQEVKDLAALFQSAAEQKLRLVASY